jgi:predicted neuraminidase
MRIWTVCVGAVALNASLGVAPPISVVSREFVYRTAPFPSAHASTIVATRQGLVAAWFGGTAEKHPDVGIWLSRLTETGWSSPVEVTNGIQPDGGRHPTWNPVLFQVPGGPLALFYKVGPSPREWWGMAMASSDGGRTWTTPRRLPDGILGPIRAKPVLVDSKTLVAGSSTEDRGWRVHMETLQIIDERRATNEAVTSDRATTEAVRWIEWVATPRAWTKTRPLNAPAEFGAIQPTILVHGPARLQILCRTQQRVIAESWSSDGGTTWSGMKATRLPNPSAGIDSVRLPDGRFVLAYNPSADNRRSMALAISSDGIAWSDPMVVEEGPGEYSYPAIITTDDGLVHLTYTWRRERIRHIVLKVS